MDIEKIRLFRKGLRQLEIGLGGKFRQDGTCCGVTLSQCHTLLEIGRKGEISIVELASSLGLDTSTLSRTIDSLVNLGLAHRKINPSDRRYVSINLTKAGKALFDSIENFYNSYFSRVFRYIPEEKQGQAVESFLLVSEAIKKSNESSQARGRANLSLKKGERFKP